MALLYGMHDREGAHILPSGGWCVDTRALSENPAPTDYTQIRGDINWLVRLNWGYGSTGTIPLPQSDKLFFDRLAYYVHGSKGVHAWIIGNEPNHEQERPNGAYISPERYAHFFVRARTLIKTIDPNACVIPAPCAPYHANPVNWLEYWREMLTIIAGNGGCDGITIHAYARSSDPYDINENDIRMGPGPLEGQFAGFLTYVDAFEAVPHSLRHLPAYITEFTELLPDGWDNRNTGVVQAAYQSVHGWNQLPDAQKIQCLILYRWPRYDKWAIEHKQGVIDDFRQAVGRGYQSPPVSRAGQTMDQTHLPSTPNQTPAAAPQLPGRDIDPRLIERGVNILTPQLAPGDAYWRVVRARWYSEQEAGGRHHIFVETITPDGRPVAGVPFEVTWPSKPEGEVFYTKAGKGFDAGNYPMSASLREFSVRIADGVPSETVTGIGMGADGNPRIHTSTLITYQLATVPKSQPQPAPPATVPALAHPIADPSRRIISQRFGENPQAYARFGLAGHTGIDFAVPMGTPVGAVDSGVVLESGTLPDYGEYIKIRHVWGESLYAHLSARKVEAGEPVNRGYVIGRSGNTGNSTGPHLHFAMRVYPYKRGYPWDGFSDPAPYLINTPPAPEPVISQKEMVKAITAAALEFDVDPDLLLSQAWAESSFNPRAVSSKGAKGLLQIMPNTWAEWSPKIGAGDDPFDPQQNARVGARYLKEMLRLTGNNPYQALIAYGWGPGNWQSDQPRPDVWVQYANKIVHGRDLLKAVGA